MRFSTFPPAVQNVVQQRVDPERLHVGIVLQIKDWVEDGMGLSILFPTLSQIMYKRINALECHIRIAFQVISAVEEGVRIPSVLASLSQEMVEKRLRIRDVRIHRSIVV